MEAADEFNSRTSELVVKAVPDPVLQSSTTLKVEKALTAARRIQGEEELMEREAVKRNAHLPRLSVQELKLHNTMESLRQPLHEELERAPYVDVVALPQFNTCLRRIDDHTWEQIGALSPKRSQICLREVTAKGFGLSGADHWGRTKAQIRALLLPRANQLLQLASVKQMLAEARMRGQRVLVCGGFVFWYEDDGVRRWVLKTRVASPAAKKGTPCGTRERSYPRTMVGSSCFPISRRTRKRFKGTRKMHRTMERRCLGILASTLPSLLRSWMVTS